MASDFAGETSRLYACFRRDLPTGQAADLAVLLGLRAGDVVVDLGCGTGQLGVPLRAHCAGVVGLDPEPGMLAGLRGRGVAGVLGVLGSDRDLPELGRVLAGPVGAVVVGNALHWMQEAAALAAAAQLVRPGGGVAVITQGPPLWLGAAPWQQLVRAVLEQILGPVSSTCGSDADALQERRALLAGLGLEVQVATWRAQHRVEVDWVVGHLAAPSPAAPWVRVTPTAWQPVCAPRWPARATSSRRSPPPPSSHAPPREPGPPGAAVRSAVGGPGPLASKVRSLWQTRAVHRLRRRAAARGRGARQPRRPVEHARRHSTTGRLAPERQSRLGHEPDHRVRRRLVGAVSCSTGLEDRQPRRPASP